VKAIPVGPGRPPATAPRPTTLRLFIALWPGPVTRQRLADWCDGWTWPAQAARVAPPQLHLTLHFIGAVPAERLPELARALALPGAAVARGALHFGRPELWPRGLAVASPLEVPEALQQLHARLGQALQGLGLPVEARAYRPHVTLARKAAGAQPNPEPLRLRWPVGGYALVQSAGSYRTLRRYPL